MKKIILVLLMILLVFNCKIVLSQIVNDTLESENSPAKEAYYPGWNFMLKLGSNLTKADIREYDNYPNFNTPGFEGRIGIGYYLTPWLNPRVEGSFGYLNGIDTKKQLEFNSNILEGALTVNINALNLILGNRFRKFWINLYGGVGTGFYTSKQYHYDDRYFIDEVGVDRRETMLTFPFGGDISYAATPAIDFHLGVRYTFTNTDNLDIYEAGNNDSYTNYSFGFTYKILRDKIKMDEEYTIRCEPEFLEKNGEKVPYEIIIQFPPDYFNKKAVMCLQPVVRSYDGKELLLAPILIRGEEVPGTGHIAPEKGGEIVVSGSFEYSDEFNRSEFLVTPLVYKYNGSDINCPTENIDGNLITLNERLLAQGIIHTSDRYMIPTDARVVSANMPAPPSPTIIYFEKNKNKIRYLGTMSNESSIMNDIAKKTGKLVPLIQIKVESYTSPEGTERHNLELANLREEATKKLISKVDILEGTPIAYEAIGENWTELSSLLNARKDQAEEFVNIISELSGATTHKEKEAIADKYSLLDSKVENEIYPMLRKSVINYSYENTDTLEFVNRLYSIYREDPGKLSDEALLFLALEQTDEKTSREILEKINSAEASVIIGALEIYNGNYHAALSEMKKYPNSTIGELWYNRALAEMHAGDWTSAKESIMKSERMGVSADNAKAVLLIRDGDYKTALDILEKTGSNCSYNIALVLLLNNELEKAKEVLSCTKSNTGDVEYLLAVIAARQHKEEDVYKQLSKAVIFNAKLKNEAKHDVEFAEYFDSENFRLIVQ